jgi:hypothetical protein
MKMISEKIMSISAIIIAITSITVTIWEAKEIRHHNRLSVRPKFEIYFSPNSEKNRLSWVIMNNGIGPCFYKYSKVFIDSTEYKLNYASTFNEISNVLRVNDVYISDISSFNPGLTIKSGDVKRIISLDLKEEGTPTKEFWKLHDRFRFEIGYESMYNELFICKYPMDSR